MLAIGRELMTNPDCLLIDEPSEGLAPIIIQHVREVIARLRDEGLSILLVEQNAVLAVKLVDYVHVISKGRIVYSGQPQELWANEDVKVRYLGISPEHLGIPDPSPRAESHLAPYGFPCLQGGWLEWSASMSVVMVGQPTPEAEAQGGFSVAWRE